MAPHTATSSPNLIPPPGKSASRAPKSSPKPTSATARPRTPPSGARSTAAWCATPCCGAVYCEECVQTHLLEKDFACPACGARIASLDRLVADGAVRARVVAYIEKEIEASKREAEEGGSGTPGSQVMAFACYFIFAVPPGLTLCSMPQTPCPTPRPRPPSPPPPTRPTLRPPAPLRTRTRCPTSRPTRSSWTRSSRTTSRCTSSSRTRSRGGEAGRRDGTTAVGSAGVLCLAEYPPMYYV
ncbi:hypothetical protein OF83DRAFT_1107129 [Amylostereum chailletii]|nr:hypothetical protein OF83DRAFT_1107129 [Amylostereum chailletii]